MNNVHFKWASFVVYELYVNKAVTKKKTKTPKPPLLSTISKAMHGPALPTRLTSLLTSPLAHPPLAMLTSFLCLKQVQPLSAYSLRTYYTLCQEHSSHQFIWLTSPFPSDSPFSTESSPGLLSRTGLVFLSSQSFLRFPHPCPDHFGLCFPHHNSKILPVSPVLALTTVPHAFASELNTLASTSLSQPRSFCLHFPLPSHERSGLPLPAAGLVSPTKLGSP